MDVTSGRSTTGPGRSGGLALEVAVGRGIDPSEFDAQGRGTGYFMTERLMAEQGRSKRWPFKKLARRAGRMPLFDALEPRRLLTVTAVPQFFGTPSTTTLLAPAPGVLANATDTSSLTLHPILVQQPQYGTLTLNDDGSFQYVPSTKLQSETNPPASDTFTYEVTDGTDTSSVETVTIYLNPVNQPPVASSETYSAVQNTGTGPALSVASPGVLSSAYSPDAGVTLSASLVSNAAHGVVDLSADGAFTYLPAVGFIGTDSFSYLATDSNGLTSSVETVALNVGATDTAPSFATSPSFTVTENNSIYVANPGVLATVTNPSGNTLSAILVDSPTHGALTLQADGSFTYTPNTNFAGTGAQADSFTFYATDGTVSSPDVTVTLDVVPTPITPTAGSASFSMNERTSSASASLTIAAPGLLLSDQYPSGTPTITVLNGPLDGVVTVNNTNPNNGEFTYTPDIYFTGTDSLTYYLSYEGLTSNVATVTINVAPVPIAPVASPASFTLNENTMITVAAPGVLANDTAYNGATLSAILIAAPTYGTVVLSSDGSFIYTPEANFHGTDTFQYVASNGTQVSNAATVTLSVAQVAAPPIAHGLTYTTQEFDQLSVPAPGVLATATDPQGSSLSAVLLSTTSNGTLSLAPSGGFTYTPNPGFAGTDTFTYEATDGTYTSAPATVTIVVQPIAATSVTIDPITVTGASSTDRITSNVNPAFIGTTVPGLLVQLYVRPEYSSAQPTLDGAAYADADGNYRVISSPLSDGTYSFWIQSVRLNGVGTGIVSAGNVQIATQPVVVTNIFMVPRTGQIMVTYSGAGDGIDLSSILNRANYSFSKRTSSNPRSYEITSVTLVPPASTAGPVTVALTSSDGRRIKDGHYLFAILSGGIADLAGNLLDGAYSGSFPTGDGAAGSQLSGMFINHGQPNVPLETTHFIPILTKHSTADAVGALKHRGPLARMHELRSRTHES